MLVSDHVNYHIVQGLLMGVAEIEGRHEKAEQIRNQGLVRLASMSESEKLELAQYFSGAPGSSVEYELAEIQRAIDTGILCSDKLTLPTPIEFSEN